MQAVVVKPGESTGLGDISRPTRSENEALVRVRRAGICNTDLELMKGYMGYSGVLGHEFMGEITEADDSGKVKVGQRVVGEINAVCDQCDVCTNGGVRRRNHCPNRQVLGILNKDGTYAEYLTLPASNLFAVPDQIPDDAAALVEPLAAAFRVIEQGVIRGGDRVAVVGDGKLGLLIAQVIRTSSYPSEDGKDQLSRLAIFGKHEHKMSLLDSQLGDSSFPLEKILVNPEMTRKQYEDQFDVVVEASGSPSGLMMASDLTRPLGSLVLKTTCAAGDANFNTAPFVIKEIKIVGSRCGNFPMALEALASGKVKVDALIERKYPLAEAMTAIEHAGKRGTLKILLTM